jgi:hypothetical protein
MFGVGWCCAGFEENSKNAGGKTFSIVIDCEGGEPLFVLQHRLFEPGEGDSFVPDRPIAVVSELRLTYCPFCGAKLARRYRKVAATLARPDLRVIF